MSEEMVVFHSRDDLMTMPISRLVAQASMVGRIMKAALTRQEDPARTVIGYDLLHPALVDNTPPKTYTWNFDNPDNRDFVTRAYVPHARDILAVARERSITAIEAFWGPQLVYAIEHGSVNQWSFNEISGILAAEGTLRPPLRSAQIIPFRRPQPWAPQVA